MKAVVLSVALLGVYVLSEVVGELDICPGELEANGNYVGRVPCRSNDDCPADKVCVPSIPRYPGMWICARKPCHSHRDCKYGRYCYKKYRYGHPTVDWAIKGICCETIN